MSPEQRNLPSLAIDFDTCGPDDLARLLCLAAAPRTLDELLSIRPIDIVVARLLTELSATDSDTGGSLLRAAVAPNAALDSLRDLKDTAKRLLVQAKQPEHRTAATFLYHAANAAALARHGADISTIPLHNRLPIYAQLAAALAPHPLGALFEAAARGDRA